MQLNQLPGAIITLVLVAMIGAAGALALTEFQDDVGCGGTGCVLANSTSVAFNVTHNGLVGTDNVTSFLDTIGTIIAVAALIGIVIGAFAFFGRR